MELLSEIRDHWLRLSALLLVAAIFALYVGGSIRNLQYRLLYYPDASLPNEEFLRSHGVELWQKSGTDYRGLLAAAFATPVKGTVLVFHGNGGAASDRIFYKDMLGALGYRVVLAEYPMYGGRKGELGEKAFVGDAKASVRLAFEDFGGPIYILGESLGCGIAAAVAKDAPVRIDGLILVTPWDTLASIAAEKFPFLPIRLLLRDEYDSIGNLSAFEGRVAVIAAGRDEIIPAAHAEKLYNSLSSPAKKYWSLPEAGHNDWYLYAGKAWWSEIMHFVSGNNAE